MEKTFRKYELLDNIIYVNVTEAMEEDSFYDDLNNTLKLEDNNKVTAVPTIIYFKEGTVKSVIKSAIPMKGAASVDPLNFTIFKFKLFSSKYFLVNTGNSVATFISSFISDRELILDSSGAAKTKFVCQNLKSRSSLTSDSLSFIKSTPVIPISATPSLINSGISDALANITSIFSLTTGCGCACPNS